MLDNWYSREIAKGREFGMRWDVARDNNFTSELYEEIDSLNPCEIFYQNVNHYIQDKAENEV